MLFNGNPQPHIYVNVLLSNVEKFNDEINDVSQYTYIESAVHM